MKRHIIYIATLALAFGLASCENDDTDFSGIINPVVDYELRDIEFDTTPLAEAETVPADDNDYVENSEFTREVYINFSGDTAYVQASTSGFSATVSGAHVTVNATRARMHYILSGTTADGGLKIYSERKFKLTMNGVSITNPTGAAINNQCGKSMYIVLADSTENVLTDGTTYQTPANEDEKGTLFSEGQIIFSGKGMLSVTSSAHNGIASDDYIIFRPGCRVSVVSHERNCVKANDGVSVRGGVLNLDSHGDGGKAINSEAGVDISGGRVTAIVSGGGAVSGADTTGVAAIKCDSSLVMTGGEVNLKCTGDGGKGINANGDVTVSGGSVTIETFGGSTLSSPKGIKADGKALFDGGETYVYSANGKPVDADEGMTVGATMTATYSNDSKLLQIKQ